MAYIRIKNLAYALKKSLTYGFCCSWSSSSCGFSSLWSCRCGTTLSVGIQDVEISADIHGVALGGHVFLDNSCFWRGDINSDFVGLDSGDDLIGLDEVTRPYKLM